MFRDQYSYKRFLDNPYFDTLCHLDPGGGGVLQIWILGAQVLQISSDRDDRMG